MAFLAMANSIRLSGLLGWDYGSKSVVVPNIDSCGCSCFFFGRWSNYVSIGVTVIVLFVFMFVVVVFVVVVVVVMLL